MPTYYKLNTQQPEIRVTPMTSVWYNQGYFLWLYKIPPKETNSNMKRGLKRAFNLKLSLHNNLKRLKRVKENSL